MKTRTLLILSMIAAVAILIAGAAFAVQLFQAS